MDLTKQAVLEAVRRAPAQGWKTNELAAVLTLDTKGRHRLRRLVDELVRDGAIVRVAGARYLGAARGAPVVAPGTTAPAGAEESRTGAVEARTGAEAGAGRPDGAVAVGRIRVHPAGYGFVEREDGEADVFVPGRHRSTALDGDRVRVATWMGVKGVEGRVEEVLARGRAKLTGTIRHAGRHVYLEPDDPRIASTYGRVGLEEGGGGVAEGVCALVEITKYPTLNAGGGGDGGLAARVLRILGESGDPRTEVAKVIACADIPDTFPEEVQAAGTHAPTEIAPSDATDRVDLRDRPFLTIDPETARDFDDAVCVEPRGDGFRLWVAVADVSHYVPWRGALDREARVRGCSVYLPDRAIPMLPHELSAGICSLNPEVDRLAMVVRIDLTADGVPTDKGFSAAVIRSHARLDYPGAAAALAGDFRGPRARYRRWADALAMMNGLARKMRERRRLRGALDLDIPEATVILDDDDPTRVRDVRSLKASSDTKIAYQLVEEFMLAANEAVAQFFAERGLDCMWRVHDVPATERLEEFAHVAEAFGIRVPAGEMQTPRGMQTVLSAVVGKPYERALSFLLLRSLKQATYDVVNVGHFGLGSPEYLHFTSPIRRYPDLVVHRLLKFQLRREGQAAGGRAPSAPPPREKLAEIALECSGHERRAVQAEREVVDMYRAHLMRDRIGEELDGVVSGVTSFGLFVECTEPFVEGLIRLERLGGDRFEHDERGMRLVGRRSGRSFTLGAPVRVRVEDVSVARRRIDLALVGEGPAAGEATRPPRQDERRRRPEPPRRGERPRTSGGTKAGGRRKRR